MKLTHLVAGLVLFTATGTMSDAQITYRDYNDYCDSMGEASTPTLLSRVKGISKEQSKSLMAGMTDPVRPAIWTLISHLSMGL